MCSERSGSNLITKIVDKHSQYCGPSPTHLFRILLDNHLKYGKLEDDRNWENLLRDTCDLFNSKLGVWRTHFDLDQLITQISDRSVAAVLRYIYESEAKENDKSRLFVKENHLYIYISFLLTEFEDSKFLFFVRDPRDMALSWKLSPNLRGCVLRAANTWKRDQKEYLQLFSCLSRQNRSILMRYEDLLAHPENSLNYLCNFLDIEFENELFDFKKSDLTTKNADSSMDWKNLSKPLMRNNFNKYQSHLSEEEIKYIECLCRDEMDILGYKVEFDKYLDIEAYETAISKLELYEKPAYMKLPEKELEARKARRAIESKILQKRPVNLLEQISITT
jgi:hypothetical protein